MPFSDVPGSNESVVDPWPIPNLNLPPALCAPATAFPVIAKAVGKIIPAAKDLLIPGSPKTGLQSKIQTPPLPSTPMPAKMASNTLQKNPQTNLTQTEEALLSPTEKVIASRTT